MFNFRVNSFLLEGLALKAPITTAADENLMYTFALFSEKISFDISCEFSARQRFFRRKEISLNISCEFSARQRIFRKNKT